MTKAKLPGSKQRGQAGEPTQAAVKPDGPPSEAPNAGAGCGTAQGGERPDSAAGRPTVDERDAVQPEERDAAKDPAPGAGPGMQNGSELAAIKEILGIVRHLSEWTKEDRTGDGDWLKADIGKLLKLTGKAAASADKSRTLLNRLPAAGALEQEPGEAGNRLEEAIEAHTADFHRWSDIDRRRRRWAGLAMAVAVPALFPVRCSGRARVPDRPAQRPDERLARPHLGQLRPRHRRLRGAGDTDRQRGRLLIRCSQAIGVPTWNESTSGVKRSVDAIV